MAKKKPKSGAPCKITPAVRRKLLKYFRAGGHVDEVCMAAGTSRRAVARLRAKDKEFARAITEARAKGRMEVAVFFQTAAKKDWKAAQKYLAAVDPDRWSEKRRNDTKTHLHAHAHAAVPPSVVFEIIDKRLGNGTNQATSSPGPSGLLEQ